MSIPEEQRTTIRFISRHPPNNGQLALIKEMGYQGIEQVRVDLSDDPVKDLEKARIFDKVICIVAPSYITNILLNEGYTLIEFVNFLAKRELGVFCCKGAYKYRLKQPRQGVDCQTCWAHIEQEYYECPMTVEAQIESSLEPRKEVKS